MSLDVGDLLHVLRRMLEEVNNAALGDGLPDEYELPERQYVTTGGSVYDCEQVTVSANSLSTGIAGGQADPVGNCAPGWNAQFEVAIVRCARQIPTGRDGTGAPLVSEIELDTVQVSADVAIVTRAVTAIAGPGWDQFGQVPASIAIGETEGGMFAVVLSVNLNIWNFEAQL